MPKPPRSGGGIAKRTRRELEDHTGQSVVTGQNYLLPAKATKQLDATPLPQPKSRASDQPDHP